QSPQSGCCAAIAGQCYFHLQVTSAGRLEQRLPRIEACRRLHKRQFRTVAATVRYGFLLPAHRRQLSLVIRRPAPYPHPCFGRDRGIQQKSMPDTVRLTTVKAGCEQCRTFLITGTILSDQRYPCVAEVVEDLRARPDKTFSAEEPHRKVLVAHFDFESGVIVRHGKYQRLVAIFIHYV